MWKLLVALLIGFLGVSFLLFYLAPSSDGSVPEPAQTILLKNFNNFDMVNFNLVHGKSHMNFTRYYIRDYLKLLSDENFSSDRKTLLYVHGWIEDFYSESVATVVDAYIQRGDHNIIVINWGQYSFGEYFSVIPRFTQISKMIGRRLVSMFERGLDINQLHCVGHSFGAHIMGIVGREVNRRSSGKYKIKRITGLDAAHFGFWPPVLDGPLSPSDAEFVDAIHSDVNFIGTANRVGHVDFFPNARGQLQQPGCPPYRFLGFMDIINSFCSHQHSWRYWAQSVKPGREQNFPATSCKSFKKFKAGKCNQNQINFMGYGALESAPGVFYLDLRSSRNYTVDDSYYMYLVRSLAHRSDLTRIVARVQQFFGALTQKTSKERSKHNPNLKGLEKKD